MFMFQLCQMNTDGVQTLVYEIGQGHSHLYDWSGINLTAFFGAPPTTIGAWWYARITRCAQT